MRWMLIVLLASPWPANALQSMPDVYSEAHADGRVTFRILAPNARTVAVHVVGIADPTALARTEDGVWSVTVGPLRRSLVSYSFLVDGLRIADPGNPSSGGSYRNDQSLLEVPHDPPAVTQRQAISTSAVHRRWYHSEALGRAKSLYVYVPPGYDRSPDTSFPVLYLRHGAGGLEDSWLEGERADVILDNLIGQGRARPMLVVMTNGYVDDPVGRGLSPGRNSPEAFEVLGEEMMRDVIPFVEANYRVLPGAENRAVAGLSMGGGQAFLIGLRNREHFAWVGAFSSGRVSSDDFDLARDVPGLLEDPSATNGQLKLLWLSCGSDDPRLAGHRRLVAQLEGAGIRHHYRELPGGHESSVWQQDLADFAQLVFR